MPPPPPDKQRSRAQPQALTTPGEFGNTTPPPQLNPDFALQAARDLGKLEQAVVILSERTNEHERQIDRLKVGFYAGVIVGTILLGVLVYIFQQFGAPILRALDAIAHTPEP